MVKENKTLTMTFSIQKEHEDFMKNFKAECKKNGVSASFTVIQALKLYLEGDEA